MRVVHWSHCPLPAAQPTETPAHCQLPSPLRPLPTSSCPSHWDHCPLPAAQPTETTAHCQLPSPLRPLHSRLRPLPPHWDNCLANWGHCSANWGHSRWIEATASCPAHWGRCTVEWGHCRSIEALQGPLKPLPANWLWEGFYPWFCCILWCPNLLMTPGVHGA